ncbi:hypothetical protein FRC12_025152 [Ceratobasidium sp. 428]|nr:hypothetical protein FRC12_025152 [Ceratobasidium sp. 428]
MNLVLARTLFALYLGDSGAGALNTLVVSGVWDKELTIPWSTYFIRGLTALELYNLQQPACPALDELTTMLSNCPHLRTLRLSHLRNSIIRRNEQRNRRTISLPHLQLLDVAGLEGDVLVALLEIIHPGKLDLHVRLGIQSGERRVSPAALSLFARSNVASLALSSDASDLILTSESPFTCLLGLRALRVDCTDSSPETLLEALTHHNMLQSLPSLQLLCISGGEVDQGFMDDVKSLVGARPLRSLLFWSCKFPVFYRRVANKVKLQDRSRGSDGAANLSYRPMPETTKKWLMKRVERLVISETPPTRISDNVDALAQEMTKLGSADYL